MIKEIWTRDIRTICTTLAKSPACADACGWCYVSVPTYSLRFTLLLFSSRGTRWHSSFSHCARNWKVAGSIRDGVLVALGVDTASNRNEYQEYFLGGKGGQYVGLTTLPPSCAHCLETWELQPPGTFRVCPDLYRDCFTFLFFSVVHIAFPYVVFILMSLSEQHKPCTSL